MGVRVRLLFWVCFPPFFCGFLPFSSSVGPVVVPVSLRSFLSVVLLSCEMMTKTQIAYL